MNKRANGPPASEGTGEHGIRAWTMSGKQGIEFLNIVESGGTG
jgi:hypothetical protein